MSNSSYSYQIPYNNISFHQLIHWGTFNKLFKFWPGPVLNTYDIHTDGNSQGWILAQLESSAFKSTLNNRLHSQKHVMLHPIHPVWRGSEQGLPLVTHKWISVVADPSQLVHPELPPLLTASQTFWPPLLLSLTHCLCPDLSSYKPSSPAWSSVVCLQAHTEKSMFTKSLHFISLFHSFLLNLPPLSAIWTAHSYILFLIGPHFTTFIPTFGISDAIRLSGRLT